MDAAHSTAAWRERGFYPILARGGSAPENLDGSLLFQMVEAGMQQNTPGFSRQSVDAARQARFAAACPPSAEALRQRLSEHPGLGMPFGLPAISTQDFETLKAWVAAGSPGPTLEQRARASAVADATILADWEAFFNDPDPRRQLVSRFIFEHVYQATIVLEESPGDRFRLVRSSTPPARVITEGKHKGQVDIPPVEVIGTGLPYDDPYSYAGVDRFWYRLQKITDPPVQKNLWLWRLGRDDIADLRELFFAEDWDESGDLHPPWDVGNPFLVFAAIPAEARYRFLLRNAEVIVGGITYGPVCNGQTATYAVKDQFWVFFLDPSKDVSVQDPTLGLETWDLFMDRSAFGNRDYLDAYAEAQARLSPDGWTLDAIWDGDGDNRNAWLTVLRHETNVSVLQGARGGFPRTFWLLGYSGLERMYYDTVAGFKYWAGDGHKLQTLLFFNFLRQEFQDSFLLLLPPDQRESIRQQWTQGVGAIGLDVVPFAGADRPSRVAVDAEQPLRDLLDQIAERLGPTISALPDRLNPSLKPAVAIDAPMRGVDDWERAISTLTAVKGQRFVRYLPSVIVLRLNAPSAGAQGDLDRSEKDSRQVYSLVANRVYKSQFTLVFQNGQALPDEDTLSVYPTLVNGFPNLFVDLDLADAPRFLTDLRGVQSSDDWERFAARYGIRRTSEAFWPFYDWINGWNVEHRGDAAGWLDLTYYDAPEL